MKQVFADTLYWIAIFLPGDPWASAAGAVDLSGACLVTTEEVLSEFLTAVSAQTDRTRRLACGLVREILTVMRRKGIREILTNDRHFSQEGFVRLLEKRI